MYFVMKKSSDVYRCLVEPGTGTSLGLGHLGGGRKMLPCTVEPPRYSPAAENSLFFFENTAKPILEFVD